ncbi:MAG TPA: isoleucine--tRNA ligase [Candidatus Magasanikbacteria bacterium]|nr:isoleucine--tRNA ligase [Candidatus Magasanikbacteria bacterium]
MLYNANEEEQKILDYWDEKKCFEKSIEKNPEDKLYAFYDGPPFATGLPHYGHIVASLMKDVVPRYFTMRGFRVERKWGWDCHGLPVENIIEKDLSLGGRKDIEDYGIAKFNEACRSSVMTYAQEWKKTVRRIGRWVDMENDYKTMNVEFMESVWWVFRQLWDQNLIYKGHKPMHICPRCSTPLSNFEASQGYKDIKDISVTVKFKVANPELLDLKELYILAWTTTPWTLPGNVLLAMGGDIQYVVVKAENTYYLVAKDRAETVFKDIPFEIVKQIEGDRLTGLKYEPLFPYFANTENAFRVVNAVFVTTVDGTGVVHIAPAFGEDDFNVGQREKIPLVQHVDMTGRFIEAVKDFVGQEVKPKEDPQKTDVEIIKWLAGQDKLFSKEKIEHSYPHCWRCDTPLLNYATDSWFVKVTDIKDQMLKNNQKINWVPAHIKEGRFGDWLETARDWAISRNRFWGTPLPIWESKEGDRICIGSVKELEELSGQKITDLHKHFVDQIIIKKDGKEYYKIPEVLDCWFESGSMPYAQMHYPFENKEKFEKTFPAEFIAEGQDQTRGWFYTLHILATALSQEGKSVIPKIKNVPAFKNVIVNGMVLAADGKKMSKSLRNYPDPEMLLQKYGADAVRYYLATSPVMEAEDLNFSEESVREVYGKLINTLWNVYEFYEMFSEGKKPGKIESKNILDKWILAKLNLLVKEITENMENYRLVKANRPILEFVTELSQWYVRRSRDRFKGNDEEDKKAALSTTYKVLLTLSKVMAPATPFIAEKIYLALGGEKESVHLEDWPEAEKIDEDILTEMEKARKVVEIGLSLRAEKGLKVRQPLFAVVVNQDINKDLLAVIAEELNVKEAIFDKGFSYEENIKENNGLKIWLDVNITEELKKEGMVREIVRTVNQMRKDQKLTVNDKITLIFDTQSEELKKFVLENEEKFKQSVLAEKIEQRATLAKEIEIDGEKMQLAVEKI